MRSGPFVVYAVRMSYPDPKATTPDAPQLHHLRVRRTARYCTLGEEAGARSVWYVLHGYRQLADRFIERFREIATPHRLIVAPEALNRFYLEDGPGAASGPHGAHSKVGATWMTRHDREHEIEDYVGYLDALDRSLRIPRGARRVVVGFSQGSATAARWALLGRRRVDRLVMWGGVLPPDLPVEPRLRRLRRLGPLFVRSEQDAALPVERIDADVARLVALGVGATSVRHGGGHTIGRDALRDVARMVDPQDVAG